MDGTPAAPNTVNRKIPVFNNAMRYAVELDRLDAVPLGKIDWSPPEVDDEIDFRYVPGPRLARQIIDAVAEQGPRGRHLRAFFGCIYYAAARPAEVASLVLADCSLPDEGRGELILARSTARVGSAWTDTGESYDSRGLKRRARNATRRVPIPPVLVRMLREHTEEFGTAPDGRLRRAARGGLVLTKEYGEIWAAARRIALPESELHTPLAETAYSARKAGITLWLTSGVAPAEVARRAGHSIAVLHRFYHKVLERRHEDNARIERALAEADETP
ncbi:hypothetical protein ABZY03_12450 [Streptomyces klenkii]|uniref:hypothetical protein n=1 Tax=Streptomyces klenkii TaxID=1420899 RepID=UPI0033A12541